MTNDRIPTAADHAKNADRALQTYVPTVTSTPGEAVREILIDLMHWADENNFDFHLAFTDAWIQYRKEVKRD